MATIFQFPYRTVAEISLRALLKNLASLRALCRKEIIPVVKADAYGHGMLPVAKALVGRGSCEMVAVATLEEALELRKHLRSSLSILVLSGFLPHQLDAYIRYRLTPMIHSLSHLKSLLGRKHLPEIHLKLDTGMHRLGIQESQLLETFKTLEKLQIKLSGLATHLAESESALSTFSDTQIALFESMHQEFQFRRLLQTDARIHIANSGGILRHKLSFSTAVRPGLALYGVSPNPRLASGAVLVPIMQWKTRILSIKEAPRGSTVGYNRTYKVKKKEKLAVLPIGYADGYPRLLSNEGQVLIGGKRCHVRGRVSMDLTVVDCGGVPGAREGAVATLLGRDGKDEITAWELAHRAQTIPYEIFCGLSPRVPRLYFDDHAT